MAISLYNWHGYTGASIGVVFFPLGRILDSFTVLYYHFPLCSVKFISSFMPSRIRSAACTSGGKPHQLKGVADPLPL